MKRGTADSDDGSPSELNGPQVNSGRGTKPARSPWKEEVPVYQMGKEGGTGSHIRVRSVDSLACPHHGRDRSAPERSRMAA